MSIVPSACRLGSTIMFVLGAELTPSGTLEHTRRREYAEMAEQLDRNRAEQEREDKQ